MNALCRLQQVVVITCVLGLCALTARAADPVPQSGDATTLARLSFWVPPERMEEFEVAYRTQVTPILAGHGLDTTTSQPWQGAEGVFSRLFDVGSITEVARVKETLAQDTTWSRMLGELGTEFGPEGALRQIPYRFGLFSAPSGPGKLVEVQVDSQLAGPGRGPWRSHYVIDGLANNEVSAILQDRDGDLWFGTRYGGVSRYDGQEWQTYTVEDGLASNAVLSIAQDGDGNLWFGTGLPYDRNSGSGVSRYDGESFATFTTEHGLAQNQVMAILQDREGHIWFGTGDGVSRYDGQSFATLIAADGLAGKPVGSICQDREGSLWFGTEGGIIRYDGRTWTTVLGRDTLDDSMVWSIHQDRSGCIWFGTGLTDRRGGSGVYQYDPSAGSTQNAWTAFTAADGLASDMVHSVFEDSDGYLWFGGGKELSRYDPSAGPGESAWFDLTEEDGLAHPIVWSVCQDREGHIWLGTLGGVSRHAGPAFNTWSTADGLRGLPMPIFRDSKGNLWLGFWRGGVCRYDGEYFTTFRPSEGGSPEGGSFETALSFLEDRHGNIWFGVSAGGGAVRYDGENWRASTTADGLTHNRVHGVFEDSKGTLWFSTRGGGVSRYDGQTFKTFTTEDGLADNQVQSGISEDRNGHIWFGALGGGVSRYDGERFTTYDAEDGLARGHVWPICVDRAGDPWFGCSKGVSRYDGRSFVTYTTRDVIANAQMITIMQDRRGHVWFGTGGGGITRFDGQIFQSLAVEDGLPSNNIHFLHEDPDGTIWFSSAAGLTRFRPPSPFPPGIAIDAVVAGRRYEDPTQVSVPSGLGITTFEFHGMSFKTRTGAMVCRYRLNGYDTDWRTTNDRRVEYADLPAGSYTFEVQAVDRDLAYSEEPATVRLTVHLPYERIALLAALGIALVLIAWQAVRLVQRNRALHTSNVALASANLEIQEQTQRKSAFLASMAHDLRTPMNAIMGFTNMVLRRIGDSIPERQRDNLSKVIQASDHLLAMINDLMDLSKIEAGRMDVNPEPFDVKALVATCCATVSPLVAEKADVVLNDEVSEDVGQANTDQARLRRMVINLLSNAIKFTDSGTVTVNAASQGDQLVIAVADTGKGIPADEIDTIFDEYRQVKGSDKEGKGTGLGLSITRKFAELLEGSIGVDSEVGVGSTFTLRIPMVYSEGVES